MPYCLRHFLFSPRGRRFGESGERWMTDAPAAIVCDAVGALCDKFKTSECYKMKQFDLVHRKKVDHFDLKQKMVNQKIINQKNEMSTISSATIGESTYHVMWWMLCVMDWSVIAIQNRYTARAYIAVWWSAIRVWLQKYEKWTVMSFSSKMYSFNGRGGGGFRLHLPCLSQHLHCAEQLLLHLNMLVMDMAHMKSMDVVIIVHVSVVTSNIGQATKIDKAKNMLFDCCRFILPSPFPLLSFPLALNLFSLLSHFHNYDS